MVAIRKHLVLVLLNKTALVPAHKCIQTDPDFSALRAQLQQLLFIMSPHEAGMNVGISFTHMHTHSHTSTVDETAGPDTAETIQSEIVINDIRILHSLVPLRNWLTLKCVNPQTYLTQRWVAFHPLS